MRRQVPDVGNHRAPREPLVARQHLKGTAMSNNYSAPPPPPRDAAGYPQAPQPGQQHPDQQHPSQQNPNQQHTGQHPGQQQYPGYYPQPPAPQPHSNKKTLLIILGALAAVVIVALVAIFAWVIPTFAKPQAQDAPVPAATSQAADESAAPEASATPSGTASAGEMPAGAIPLPPGWADLQGPGNTPPEGDPLFRRFVTGESSFQYLASWTGDDTFGITTDPTTGAPMQQKAQGTEERDGDGIALAFYFFAEAEEGKYGKEPEKVKAALSDIEAKFKAMPASDLPKHLVGHKCTSNFRTTTPELREFRRTAAVVIGFECLNARGETIKAVNLFSVTPWGTPQMVGVSGHATYWDANPGLLVKLAYSYRAYRWKLDG
jgi:hypothetical protein